MFSHRRNLTQVVEFNLKPEVLMAIATARDLLTTNLSNNGPNGRTQWIGPPQELGDDAPADIISHEPWQLLPQRAQMEERHAACVAAYIP